MKERLISVSIGVLALAAFQPFGLPLFGWMRLQSDASNHHQATC